MKNDPHENPQSPPASPAKKIDIDKIVADMPAAYSEWEAAERDPAVKRVEEKIEEILKNKFEEK